MKTPKAFAALITSACAICLGVGLAYAVEAPLPTEEPAPEQAQDTSITKQVAVTVIYQDEKEADAMAAQLEDSRNQALEALAKKDDQAAVGKTIGTASALKVAKDATDEKYGITERETNKELETETVESEQPAVMEADTIDVNGTEMSYAPSFETASAPATGAGLWMGSDSTTDGTWGYFIGHNPGPFTCVMSLKNGDPVTVCDGDGHMRTYHVVDEFVVPDTTYWEDIQSRVTTYGESIILQTCCGDNAHYRVVVAN